MVLVSDPKRLTLFPAMSKLAHKKMGFFLFKLLNWVYVKLQVKPSINSCSKLRCRKGLSFKMH
jgi:hypothetical protein